MGRGGDHDTASTGAESPHPHAPTGAGGSRSIIILISELGRQQSSAAVQMAGDGGVGWGWRMGRGCCDLSWRTDAKCQQLSDR